MPGYIAKALKRFNYKAPKKAQHQPHPHKYGKQIQYVPVNDTGSQLDKQQQKFIQEVTRTFLNYAGAVNGTMLTTLGALATKQATPTRTTVKKTIQFLDYAASNCDAMLTY